MARVAIGIPFFNEEQYIAASLASALRQLELFSDLEIIVSDNCSTDQSARQVEAALDTFPQAQGKVRLMKQPKNLGASQNFYKVLEKSDSEFFIWLGGHDKISESYISDGVEHLLGTPETAMFCGAHKVMNLDGAVADKPVIYDFSQANPAERYLQSVARLSNCYIFHSLFRRQMLHNYVWKDTPSQDIIIISRWLWHGRLVQSPQCSYARRYFPPEDRKNKSQAGNYAHTKNNIEFYEHYLSDLEVLAENLPRFSRQALIRLASDLLVKRFGPPFIQPG